MDLVSGRRLVLALLYLESEAMALVAVVRELALQKAGLAALLAAGLVALPPESLLTIAEMLGLAVLEPLQTVSRRRVRCRTSTPRKPHAAGGRSATYPRKPHADRGR
ncbi:hypothetical protein GCM10009006_34530 [Haloarcula argentinensis]|uniref:Uncharacterized protein n=1 Tax=Haloarcula argentinensis TaxID=43776 RepID=A0A830FRI7_HALAR|nr:hypothetical protein GCM10009006_34530 [Haloarcula argentinensis]